MSADSRNVELIEKVIEAFQVDTVFVLDFEKLYNELLAKHAPRVHVVKIEKSGGVIDVTPETKQKQIEQRLASYFRGVGGSMKAYQVSIPMTKYKLFRIFSTGSKHNGHSREPADHSTAIRHDGGVPEH